MTDQFKPMPCSKAKLTFTLEATCQKEMTLNILNINKKDEKLTSVYVKVSFDYGSHH